MNNARWAVLWILLSAICGSLLSFSTGHAQAVERLEMRLVRRFGFQAGLQVQGSFSAHISGTEDLESVSLYLDGERIGVDDAKPFRIDFNTGDYAPGEHRLWVEGLTESGGTLRSEPRRLIFLTAEQGLGSVADYLLPIFVLMGAGILLSYLLTLRGGNRDRFELGKYGSAGGAVCRRCNLPFSRHFLAPNLVLGKLERCPHCGLWAIVPRATSRMLADAEARYQEEQGKGSFQAPEQGDNWEQRLEDSRFRD